MSVDEYVSVSGWVSGCDYRCESECGMSGVSVGG